MSDKNWKKTKTLTALKETYAAVQSVYDARDRIHLIRGGYNFAIPEDATIYLARVSQWLRELETSLEEELGMSTNADGNTG